MGFVANYLSLQQQKCFVNQSRIDKVIAMFRVTHLFLTHAYCGSRVMWRNVYSSAVFIGESSYLRSNLTCTGLSPSSIFGVRKLDTGLPNGEDCISLHSLVLTQYRNVTD